MIKKFIYQDTYAMNSQMLDWFKESIETSWPVGNRMDHAYEAIKLGRQSYRLAYTVNPRDGLVSSVCAYRVVPVHGADMAKPFNQFAPEIRDNINKHKLWSLFIAYLAGRGDGGTQHIMANLLRQANSGGSFLHLNATAASAPFYESKIKMRTFSDLIYFYIPPSVERKIIPPDLLQ